MEIFALASLLVAGAGVYLFSRLIPNFQPGNRKIQHDLQEMRDEITAAGYELVPIEKEDLEALSSKQQDRTVKKGITKRIKGVFTTIFEEPVAVYVLKIYLSRKTDALLYVKTALHDYYYWIRDKGTRIVIDNTFIGTLKDNGVLYGGKKDRMIARINLNQPDFLPIIVGEKEVASLIAPEKRKGETLSPRAFEYVKDNLSKEERALLMAMAVYELVQASAEL